MSVPNLLRMTAHLKLEEMRAYVMTAFSEAQVKAVVDGAIDGAAAEFPNVVRQELDAGVREFARGLVKEAISDWAVRREMADALRPVAMRVLADVFARAAERAEKHPQEDHE